ncbi:MAG: adenylate kinase, partial [Sulfolobales archaeon]
LEERGYRVLVLNYGDFIYQELSERGLVKSRDELRKLSIRTQLHHQANAAKRMIEYAKTVFRECVGREVLLIDTHLFIKTPAGLWPGLPYHVLTELMPDMIVLVEADPSEIIERQRRDKTRYREDYADPRFVEELLELNRREALVVATLTGSVVRVIRNEEGRAEEAARDLVESILALR